MAASHNVTMAIWRNGVLYDSRARMRDAQKAIAATSIRQLEIPRPAGPSSLDLAAKLVLKGESAPLVFERILREHNGLAHFGRSGNHVYLTSNPDLVLEVFRTHGRHTIKPPVLQSSRAVLGQGLLTAEGDQHLRQRRLLQPAFHRDRIVAYAERMVREGENHISRWQDSQTADMCADMSELTLQIAGQTLLGADVGDQAQEVASALKIVLANSTAIIQPFATVRAHLGLPPFGETLRAGDELDEILQRIIDEHRMAGDTGDLISMMIASQEDGVGMDDAQLRDEAMTIFLAGHETTAMWLTWTWLLLAQNPRQAAWLHEEIDTQVCHRLSFGDISNLPRTQAVLAESLRLYPPAWMIGRRLQTDISFQGWQIPNGSIVLAPMWVLHRSPEYWDYPAIFRPERWLDARGNYSERATVRHKGAWYPFGWGNRRCIGDQFAWTEATLLTALIARDWRFELTNPEKQIVPEGNITLRPKDGIAMTWHHR